MMVHAALFHRLGGLNEDYLRSHDVEFSWRAQLAGFSVDFARDAIVDYRYRQSSGESFLQAVRSGRPAPNCMRISASMGWLGDD